MTKYLGDAKVVEYSRLGALRFSRPVNPVRPSLEAEEWEDLLFLAEQGQEAQNELAAEARRR